VPDVYAQVDMGSEPDMPLVGLTNMRMISLALAGDEVDLNDHI